MANSVDTGYWTGTIQYQPQPYATTPLIINYGTGPDSNNISWIFEAFTDGWDSPDVAGQIVQRSADHGGWAAAQYYAPRVVQFTIHALCPDNPTRDLARALMQQILPINDLAMFQHNEPIPKVFFARRSGQIKESLPNLTDAVFDIAVTAPDPRKYGATLRVTPTATILTSGYLTIGSKSSNSSIGSSVFLPSGVTPATQNAVNFGTFETRPVISVIGPIVAPGLRNRLTGQTVTWANTTLGVGHTLSVNFDARTSYINNQYYPADITSQWWTLWPGINTIELLGSPGSQGAQMNIIFRDAYI